MPVALENLLLFQTLGLNVQQLRFKTSAGLSLTAGKLIFRRNRRMKLGFRQALVSCKQGPL